MTALEKAVILLLQRADEMSPFDGPTEFTRAMWELEAEIERESHEISAQEAINQWYTSNGGHATLESALQRVAMEYVELQNAKTPADIREEMADVVMCLFQAASIAGFDLIDAVWEKLAVNQKRKWTVSADGCLHHVRDIKVGDIVTCDSWAGETQEVKSIEGEKEGFETPIVTFVGGGFWRLSQLRLAK